jgi:4-hydroxy-4-methyl-2-oxoglutarate aldolase
MIRKYGFVTLAAAAFFASMAARPAKAQLFTWTKDQMVEYTPQWKGERFDDGRPKVADALLERAKGLSQEEISVPGGRGAAGGNYSQFTGDWKVLHPGTKLVGRAVTMAFMPVRTDLDAVVSAKAKEKGIPNLNNQVVMDMLQPGDVLVVDLGGKVDGGTIVGDNLAYYIMRATKTGGLVVDGGIRDEEGIAEFPMQVYYKGSHPSFITGVTLSAINVPVKIGNVTVMPGDIVVGDREGVSFIPPHNVEQILNTADNTHVHDEWTRKKFDEGKYKSADIYSSPKDPALKQEYADYLKKRLEEIRSGKK